MHVYIVRHAHALALNPPEIEADEDRPLSDQGREQVAGQAATIRRLGVRFDRILTSPYLRAFQTAEGLQRQLGLPLEVVETTDHLAPGGRLKKLAKVLRRLAGDHIALVGHEPDLSFLLAWLIGGKRAQVDLAKAGIACIACDEPPGKGAGRLEWLVTPAWFAKEERTHDSRELTRS
jgi:phosphohistidine phosphatase